MNVETLTPKERTEMLAALVRWNVGAVGLDEFTNTWCVPVSESNSPDYTRSGVQVLVPPQMVATVIFNPHMVFRPKKLVILEPVSERVTHEKIYGVRTTGRWWWKKEESVVERVIETPRFEVVPRGIWRVHALFVGNRCQMQNGDVSGDAFGPDGEVGFRDTCQPGLHITVQVKNGALVPAPFLAVILGTGEIP